MLFYFIHRYAKSLIELAQEQNALDAVHDDMLAFTKLCDENREFKTILSNPIISHGKKLDILNAVFGDKVNQLTKAIFTIITKKNSMYNIFPIFSLSQ